MTAPIIAFIILGAVFLCIFLRARIDHAGARSLIFKALTSACFVAVSLSVVWKTIAEGSDAGFAIFITAGLICGLLGDVWLDLKFNCPQESDTYTFAGFFAFAAGHVFFLIALIRYHYDGANILFLIIPFVLAVIMGIAIGMGGSLMKLDYGKFKTITMAYGAVLISSALVSLSLLIRSGFRNKCLLLFFIGALLFLLSDLILSGTYFGKGKNRPADIISNHVFYYAAQFIIALSAAAMAG